MIRHHRTSSLLSFARASPYTSGLFFDLYGGYNLYLSKRGRNDAATSILHYHKTAVGQNQFRAADGVTTATVDVAPFNAGETLRFYVRWNRAADALQTGVNGSSGATSAYAGFPLGNNWREGYGKTLPYTNKEMLVLRRDRGQRYGETKTACDNKPIQI